MPYDIKKHEFCPHDSLICVTWFSIQTAIVSIYSIDICNGEWLFCSVWDRIWNLYIYIYIYLFIYLFIYTNIHVPPVLLKQHTFWPRAALTWAVWFSVQTSIVSIYSFDICNGKVCSVWDRTWNLYIYIYTYNFFCFQSSKGSSVRKYLFAVLSSWKLH